MKAFRIRLRWFNLGTIAATALYLWLESLENEQKNKSKIKSTGWAGNNPSKMDEIFNQYKDKQSA